MVKSAADRPLRADPVATALAVPIGPRVIELLEIAYRARRAVLLEGPTGIGKSEIVAELAAQLGVGYQVIDLSLLEPPDLVGLPVIENGRTRYAVPAELPRAGRGILMLEELNRAELPVMQPALQLLSARRLHSYELPPGWCCVAAINPEDDDYQVNRLDPALRSRFLQLTVCAERASWLAWGRAANVHPAVLGVVERHDDAFAHASPRSWAYASEIVHVLRQSERADTELVRVALRGYLPTAWALVLADALASQPAVETFGTDELLGEHGDRALAARVAELTNSRQIDGLTAFGARIRHILQGSALAEAADEGGLTLASLERRLAPLPGDLREQCLDTAVRSAAAPALFRSLGHDPARVALDYERSPLRAEVLGWREQMQLHRVRLVVHAMVAWADAGDHDDPAALAEALPALVALHADVGSLGVELGRWLRTRGVPDVPDVIDGTR